jgi:hypothetical protein
VLTGLPVRKGKRERTITFQQRMEAYRKKEAVITERMLLMYARNLYR